MPPAAESVPLRTFSKTRNGESSQHQRDPSLLSPDHFHDIDSVPGSSSDPSDLVHLSREHSRQPSPFTDLPHPDSYRGREDGPGDDGDSDFDHWGDGEEEEGEMPSDLRRPSLRPGGNGAHSPLLSSGDKHSGYENASSSPGLTRRQSGKLREQDPEAMARAATRKRYTYAAVFLGMSLVSFAVQTETAVYIQHNLGWKKAYCML
jgi:hypothetical protein